MKILDIYILSQFIKNFLFGLLCFVLIFILVDLFENLDKFIDKNLSTALIFKYYIYFIPEILKLIMPVGMLLSTLFTVSRFNNYSELTAINAAGLSLYRFAIPLVIFGCFITLFSIYFNGWIVPISNSVKLSIERTYLDKNKLPGIIQNLHIQDTDNHIIFLGTYNEFEKTGYNSSIQIFDKGDLSKLQFRFDLKSLKWDSTRNEWRLYNISKREFSESEEKFTYIESAYVSDFPEINKIYLSPSRITQKQLKPDELMLTELNDFIVSLEESGQNVSRQKVDYYSKISFPFANIVVILFGLTLSSNKRKSGAALQFGISILIAFLYLGFVKVSQTFGYSGEINPILTAWLANIVFCIIAFLNIIRNYFSGN